MSKKLHAKDLKKDELVESLGDLWGPAVHWYEENKSRVGWTAGIVLGLLIVVGAVGSMRQSASEEAQAALGEALSSFEDAELAATEGGSVDWDPIRASFEKVADEHGGTVHAVALHYVGVAQLRGGDAAGAIGTLQEAASGGFDSWRTPLTLSVLAAAHEQAGDPAAAEAVLEDLRAKDALGFPADAATMALARFYERQGRLDEARELYSSLADDLDAAEDEAADELAIPSVYASQAQARLAELEG